MIRWLSTIAIAIFAFCAGLAVAHRTPRAEAASAPLVAQAIDLARLTAADLPPSNGPVRSKLFVDGDTMTLGVYIGPTLRHYHVNSDEFQYIVSGAGTEWFVDKTIAMRPGMRLIIPKDTPHGEVRGNVKLIGIKNPPQAPDDNHPIK